MATMIVPSLADALSSNLPSVIPDNKEELQRIIKTNPRALAPLILRDNGRTPSNDNLRELMEVVGKKQAAMALVPLVAANTVALAEIFEAASEEDAADLARLVQEFAKQNPEVALWKWFLTERGTSSAVVSPIPDGMLTMGDLGDISTATSVEQEDDLVEQEDSTTSNGKLSGPDEELMIHLTEYAPGLARAIKKSMNQAPSDSVEKWASSKTPRTPAYQQAITSTTASQVLDNTEGPKSSDYV